MTFESWLRRLLTKQYPEVFNEPAIDELSHALVLKAQACPNSDRRNQPHMSLVPLVLITDSRSLHETLDGRTVDQVLES